MRKAVTISFIFYILSCGGDDVLSEEEKEAQAQGDMTMIQLSMSEDLELTLIASQFEEPVGIMSFEVIYNANALTLKSYSAANLPPAVHAIKSGYFCPQMQPTRVCFECILAVISS